MDNKSFKSLPEAVCAAEMATIKSPYTSVQEKIRAKNNIKNNLIAFILKMFLGALIISPFFLSKDLITFVLAFIVVVIIHEIFDTLFIESYIRKSHDMDKPLEEKLLKSFCKNNRKKEDKGTIYDRKSSLLKWFFENFDKPEYIKSFRETGLEDEYLERAFCRTYEEMLAIALKIKSVDLFNDFFNYYYNGLEVNSDRLQVMNELLVEVSNLYKVTKFNKYKALSDLAKSILDHGLENEFYYISVWKEMPSDERKKKVIAGFLDERALDMDIPKILDLKLKSIEDVKKLFAFKIKLELERKESTKALEAAYEREIAEAGYEPVTFTESELEQLGRVNNSKKEQSTESKEQQD
jgi:hypothetical protein